MTTLPVLDSGTTEWLVDLLWNSEPLRQYFKNPQTGGLSCPAGYEAVFMPTWQHQSFTSRMKFHSCWLITKWFHENTYKSTAMFSVYWRTASGQGKKNSGNSFGGLYMPAVKAVHQLTYRHPDHSLAYDIYLSLDWILITIWKTYSSI